MAMMFTAAFFVFCSSVISATPEVTTDVASSESNITDGWNFIVNGSTYKMLARNFNLDGDTETTKCLTSKLTNKNESSHRVNGFIRYLNCSTMKWINVSQIYQFSMDNTSTYNIMTAIDGSEEPRATQTFVVNGTYCAGVTVVYSSTTIQDAPSDGQAKPKCIIWLEYGQPDEDADSCRTSLKELCGDFHDTYDKTYCDSTVTEISSDDARTE
uniref:Putative salivary lipocalin n=1 Tax=Rhipicephalus pulchellus TaxID=72859 RepID=L7LQK0_RHIPC